MGVVVNFKKKPVAVEDNSDRRKLWQCYCGSELFKLIEGGDCECIECHVVASGCRHFDPDDPNT